MDDPSGILRPEDQPHLTNVYGFLRASTYDADTEWVSDTQLFGAFKDHAYRNGLPSMPISGFVRVVKRAGYEHRPMSPRKYGHCFVGLNLLRKYRPR